MSNEQNNSAAPFLWLSAHEAQSLTNVIMKLYAAVPDARRKGFEELVFNATAILEREQLRSETPQVEAEDSYTRNLQKGVKWFVENRTAQQETRYNIEEWRQDYYNNFLSKQREVDPTEFLECLKKAYNDMGFAFVQEGENFYFTNPCDIAHLPEEQEENKPKNMYQIEETEKGKTKVNFTGTLEECKEELLRYAVDIYEGFFDEDEINVTDPDGRHLYSVGDLDMEYKGVYYQIVEEPQAEQEENNPNS